jgi:geranylgeranyl diphosphate synthase type II
MTVRRYKSKEVNRRTGLGEALAVDDPLLFVDRRRRIEQQLSALFRRAVQGLPLYDPEAMAGDLELTSGTIPVADLRPTVWALPNSQSGEGYSLTRAMQYCLFSPGKRLRPLLTTLAAEASGGTTDYALSAGCAVEMVHTYSLIHDDLPAMDDDDLRRGLPTCHKGFGEAMAILAGDALLTLAFQVLASEYPPATAAACCLALAFRAGMDGMVGGQVEDLAWEGKIPGRTGSATVMDLEAIHAMKTGALFQASLHLGQLTAQGERPGGPDRTTQEALKTYGRSFGLVFQITDDLLDVDGDASVTGKRVGKDAVKGKLTFPGFLGVDESRKRVRQLCEQAEEAVRPLGPSAEPLAALVRMIVERDR